MLNEHDREDGPEEGEYHFSDEGGYESSMEEEEAKAPTVTEGGGLAAKFSSYRRFVIIGAVFAGVLLVAYLIVPPLTTSTPTEIAAVNTPSTVETPAAAPSAAPAVTAPSAPVAPAAPAPAMASAAAPQAVPEENHRSRFAKMIAAEKEKLAAGKSKVMSHLASHPAEPTSSLTLPTEQLTLPGTAPAQPQSAAATQAPPSPAEADVPSSMLSPLTQELMASPVGMISPGQQMAPQAAAESKAVVDRLTAIEETNTKLIGQLHAEYSQKLAAYETQDKVLQEQVRTLNTRLASMEAEMSKLVQALNNKQQAAAATEGASAAVSEGSDNNNSLNVASSSPPAAPAALPLPGQGGGLKPNYTVQAIIPGRAWLRTESGETITVAEGDLLKSLGRVTKIDPYDGIIQVDTGTKVVTLTYGNGDYA